MKPRIARCLFVIAAAALGAVWSTPRAQADVVDTVRFQAEGIVIVWGETRTGGLSAMPQPAPATARAVPTAIFGNGVLDGLTNADEPAAPLDSAPSTTARFNVASNTQFTIDAELAPGTLEAGARNTEFRFGIDRTAIGANAQIPHIGERARPDVLSLGDLATRRTLYQADRRTAAQRGSIADQSVGFVGSWETPVGTGPVDVVFTVFAP